MVAFGIFELNAIDMVFFVFLFYVIYKLFFKKGDVIEPPLPRIQALEKQDLTVEQLRRYNGVDDEHICMAIMGQIFDVTRGKEFYGPEGPYGNLAGHDATRALATMDLKLVKDEYDDTSDLSPSDLEDAREWKERLTFKYSIVGRLLAPGESKTNYADEKVDHKNDVENSKKSN